MQHSTYKALASVHTHLSAESFTVCWGSHNNNVPVYRDNGQSVDGKQSKHPAAEPIKLTYWKINMDYQQSVK